MSHSHTYTPLKYLAVLLATIGFFFCFTTASAQVIPGHANNFITTWNTENVGTSASNQIIIPHLTGTYNYDIYWENVASSTINGTTTVSGSGGASSPTLTFPEAGIYRVEIAGDFPRIYFNNAGDKNKILTIEQWGNIVWTSMNSAFRGCSNLRVQASDAPNLSGVTSMRNMLREVSLFNDPINHWNVSNVTDMNQLFRDSISFNQPLNNWNVSNVTDMTHMFSNTSFNQPLNNWNVSQVEFMNNMFRGTPFNQSLNNWNVSNVTKMPRMFQDTPFNQNISTWDTGSVNDMHGMFQGNSAFNQNISSWDTGNVTSMSEMFKGSTSFNQDLSNWEIAGITFDVNCSTQDGMCNMFLDSALSTTNLDATLSSWATQATNLNKTNIPLHIGLKTYSNTGAQALNTLKDLGWTITEQYKATYSPTTRATLIGTGTQSPLNTGATTTAVEIKPDNRCTFQGWSDGNTNNPRTDVVTDNLSVSAVLRCSSGGTSLSTRLANLEAMGKTDEADTIRNQFGQSSTNHPTMEDTFTTIHTFLNNPPADRSKTQELINLLIKLTETLTKLLALSERE